MDWYGIVENEAVMTDKVMITIGWILICMQRKQKFKIGNLKNTENLTSHHITYIKSVPPLAIVPESKQVSLTWE